MKNIFLLCLLLGFCSGVRLSGDQAVFDAKNNFGGFQEPRRLEFRIENGLLHLEITGRDSGIVCPETDIDPRKLTVLEIRYRAEGLPEKTTGQMYFATSPEENFDGKRLWLLPSLISDGEFHTLRVAAPLVWKQEKRIMKLRLDMVDQGPGGKIDIEFIRFRSSSPDTVAEWPSVTPELPSVREILPPIPKDYFTAKMISAPEDTPERAAAGNGLFFLRKTFSAPEKIERALIQISADDKYALFLNGVLLSDRMFKNSWKMPEAVDVTDKLIPGGKNLVAVQYKNEGGPGGVLFEISVLAENSETVKFAGDRDVLCSAEPQPGWQNPKFDDSSWKKPIVHGTPPFAPWTRVLPYQSLSGAKRITVSKTAFPAEAEAGGVLRGTLKTDAGDRTFRAELVLVSDSGKTVVRENAELKSSGGAVPVEIRLPRYFSSMPMTLKIRPESGEIVFPSGEIRFQYRQKNLPGSPKAVTVVRDSGGQPRIAVNGEMKSRIFGNDLENRMTDKVFSGIPVDFRIGSLLQNTPDNDWQLEDGSCDFTAVDRLMNRILECDGKALIIPAIGLEPPEWWGAKHREELTRYSDGTLCFFSTVSPSFASEVWREHALGSLKSLIRHLERAPYAPRLGGILLTNGKTYEWQYWGGHESAKFGKLVDYSAPAKARFLREYGTEMPSFEERVSAGRKIFFDPETESAKVNANRMQSETLASFLLDSVRAVRETLTVPKLIGVYYGYHFEYAGHLWTRELCGHNRLAEVISDKAHPDFILSPPSYAIRHLGESGADMKPFRSIENAGILSILDDDTRTHRIPYSMFSQSMTAGQTRNLLRRNFGMALCRGEDISILPLIGGNEFDSPETIRDLETVRAAADGALRSGAERSAEIAVVVDEKSFDFLAFDSVSYKNYPRREYRADGTVSSYNADTLRLTGNLVSFQRGRIGKIGAPVDYLLASDVARNAGKYKFWIFLDVFTADEAFRKAVAGLRRERNVLLWFYAPGILADGKFDPENIRRLTGISVKEIPGGGSPEILGKDGIISGMPEELPLLFSPDDPQATITGTYPDSGLPAAAEKKTGESRDVFWGGNVMSPSEFRRLARAAGVHIYTEGDDVLFAGFGFLAFHAANAGGKKILLPFRADVSDLFTGEILGRNVSEFQFPASLHESRIFRIEKHPAKKTL